MVSLAFRGFARFSLVLFDIYDISLLGFLLAILGFYWVLTWFSWLFVVSPGIPWFSLVFRGFFSLAFPWFSSVNLGLTGFFLSFPGFSWFHLVFLGFLWCTWV